MKEGRMTDSELVQSSLKGNMESYRMLMDRYREQAMALALNILANYQDAEDACQEAFLKAFQNLERFDLERSFKNWFYVLLSHLCLDQVRKRNRFRFLVGHVLSRDAAAAAVAAAPNPGPSPFPGLKLLGRLRPKERTAIFLWSQEGYSGAELAAALGCSQKTAYVHLFRARTRLKAILKEETNESH
jgi:RNA polymerase sigma-70 factor (ECF subfamily)